MTTTLPYIPYQTTSQFFAEQSKHLVNAASQQNQDIFKQYVGTVEPSIRLTTDANQAFHQDIDQGSVDTEILSSNALPNIETLPFRTLLDKFDLPFQDGIIYTAEDIKNANNSNLELLANTMANVYQLKNLNNAIILTAPYFSNPVNNGQIQDPLNNDQETMDAVTNIVTSKRPFELLVFPKKQESQAFDTLDQIIASTQELEVSPLLTHPFGSYITLMFVNTSNIDTLSTRELTAQLKKLATLNQQINKIDIKTIINSPEVQRNQDSSTDSNKEHDRNQRSNRISYSKIEKIASIQTLAKKIEQNMRNKQVHQKTQHISKSIKKTFNRPNRREPDNDFKPGKLKKIAYLPDIHLYVDTSGSISIDAYKFALYSTVQLAKKMKTNLFITSFSDKISEPIVLDKVRQQSVKQLTERALKIPTVSGGTEFENVYTTIALRAKQALKNKQAPEFNILLSDMYYGFTPSYQIPKEATDILYLSINKDDQDNKEFMIDAYNHGATHIEKSFTKII